MNFPRIFVVLIASSVCFGCVRTTGGGSAASPFDAMPYPKIVGARRDGQLYTVRGRNLRQGRASGAAPNQYSLYTPIVVERRIEVDRFVNGYLTSERMQLEELLEKREEFRSTLEPILSREGLPVDLINIALLESGFNPNSRSNQGAVGLWQFVANTARSYGLRVTRGIDERRSITRSTEAAAQHFAELYDEFEDWSLVIAAYNCGSTALRRAIQVGGTRDLFILGSKGLVPSETIDFVSRFQAITKICRNPEAFGLHTRYDLSLLLPANLDG